MTNSPDASDDMCEVFDVFPDEALMMIAGLHRGFMRMIQTSNKCRVTGEVCAKLERCGCLLEMDAWCADE